MTSKHEADTHRETKRLQRYGLDADPNRVRITASETPKHVVARFLGAYVLQNAGRAWDVEAEVTENGDRVDLLDFGAADEEPLAIEFEGNPTRKKTLSKAKRYATHGPCRDILVLDLREAPDSIPEFVTWIREELPDT